MGHIPDVEMRTAIVECYALTKSLIDTCRFNNELVEGYETAHLECMRNPSEANEIERLQRAEAMVTYTDSIQESHKRALDSYRRADFMFTAALPQPPFPGDVAGQRPPGHVAGVQLVTLRGEHVAALKAETGPRAG